MKIRPEIDVFPDPEFCESQAQSSWCGYLRKTIDCVDNYRCDLFRCQIDMDTVIKCDQCKADYLKAKQTQDQIKMIKESPLDPMHPGRNK